jgi:hypothetical protein
VAAKSKLESTAFVAMNERVVERLPDMKVVATTLRDVTRPIAKAGARRVYQRSG